MGQRFGRIRVLALPVAFALLGHVGGADSGPSQSSSSSSSAVPDADAYDDPEWFLKGLPPPGWHGRMMRILEARKEDPSFDEEEFLPKAKYDDQWTVSPRFRWDLLEWRDKLMQLEREGGGDKPQASIIVEVGAYIGYTTRFLSKAFDSVIAVDINELFLGINQEYNSDRRNVQFLHTESQQFDWRSLRTMMDGLQASQPELQLVLFAFLDASHDFDSVASELQALLSSGAHFRYLFFDDYSAEPDGVKAAVDFFTEEGFLQRLSFIGEMNFTLRDGRTILGPEGVVCKVADGDAAGILQGDAFKSKKAGAWGALREKWRREAEGAAAAQPSELGSGRAPHSEL